jgi:hypothetical protein
MVLSAADRWRRARQRRFDLAVALAEIACLAHSLRGRRLSSGLAALGTVMAIGGHPATDEGA